MSLSIDKKSVVKLRIAAIFCNQHKDKLQTFFFWLGLKNVIFREFWQPQTVSYGLQISFIMIQILKR